MLINIIFYQVDAGVGGNGSSGMVKSESTTMLCDPTSPADNTATNSPEDGGGGGGQQGVNGGIGSLLSSSGAGGPGNGCVKNSAGDEVGLIPVFVAQLTFFPILYPFYVLAVRNVGKVLFRLEPCDVVFKLNSHKAPTCDFT